MILLVLEATPTRKGFPHATHDHLAKDRLDCGINNATE